MKKKGFFWTAFIKFKGLLEYANAWLDDIVFNTPGTDTPLDRKVLSIFRGGFIKPPRRKPKTGSFIDDIWNRLVYTVHKWLYILITKTFYDGKGVMTSSGVRVRSRSERTIADFLDSRCITWRYEQKMCLGKRNALPDFFLPRDGKVVIEYWGMIHLPRYSRSKERKMKLYKENNIVVVSIFPSDMKNPETSIPRCYLRDTGKPMPDYSAKKRR